MRTQVEVLNGFGEAPAPNEPDLAMQVAMVPVVGASSGLFWYFVGWVFGVKSPKTWGLVGGGLSAASQALYIAAKQISKK
ncbi:MAG: hypothetical protein Q7R39_00765 [Dehalococcoidia bacterium]|nr:hypothetical protein [Dehalococcoidia bacterium]